VTGELEGRVREIHRERMKPWLGHGELPGDREHEENVVRRVLGALAGDQEAPIAHSHALEEIGLCTDCDAAAILARLELDGIIA
jgi:hypothetical protein